ncbi:MAG: hypothetical protein K6G31_12450 [Paludibacteraceae bacterium]|nr:hypothetical protein [Paludibacteraceae bacterium]MBR6042418.1 hypothetical protein [Paludibacteraceae bacterium]MCR5570066.1 hypothetical protein [Paludibacteraceae bacterium]
MRIFIYGCLTLLALTGCSKAEEDSPIPNYRVYFETPYADYTQLQNTGTYKTYTNGNGVYKTNTYLGYGGLLVYRSFDGVARCCDLACPYCYVTKGLKMEIVPNSSLEATCTLCNSVFNLQWGSCIATSGPSMNNYMLRTYYCRDTGSTILVGN